MKRPALPSLPFLPGGGDDGEVDRVLGSDAIGKALEEASAQLDRSIDDVRAEARSCLEEMSAWHNDGVMRGWRGIGRWMLRAHDVHTDQDGLARLRELDREHSLVFLLSHRSYLDTWLLPDVLMKGGITPIHGLGGINLAFWPFGTLARRTGLIFIRRDIQNDPVYRLALRHYLAHLVAERANLCWAIEGGRTRTGKLRPPRYGLLRYVVDAARERSEDPDVLLVPVAIVYEQLHEVAKMAAEARGEAKQAEDAAWLVRFARQQSVDLGRGFVDFGEPVPLRERLAELESEDEQGAHAVERVALEVCHGINRVTPVTSTAATTLVLLAANHALTCPEVLRGLEPMIRYMKRREFPLAGGGDLRDPERVREILDELVGSGVADCFAGGSEPVWGIASDAHLVAAFYRNTAIHFLVNRAIAELIVQWAIDKEPADLRDDSWQEALRLRDLLKFEFFFSRKRDFAEEIREEIGLVDELWEQRAGETQHDYVHRWRARDWFERARPHVAPLVLRPFLETYLVLATELAAIDPAIEPDEQQLLDRCLGVAEQWRRQGRLTSAESVSLEILKTAMRLARHRGLLEGEPKEMVEGRRAFLEEVRSAVERVAVIARMARESDAVVDRPMRSAAAASPPASPAAAAT